MMKNYLTVTLMIMVGLTACAKKNVTQNNSTANVGEAASVKAYPGNQRVKLSWQLPSGDQISSCHISWDNRADSVVVAVKSEDSAQDIIINNLKEGDHTFSVIDYDQSGNASAAVNINAHAYGKHYEDSLHNRSIYKSAYDDQKKEVNISWNDAGKGAVKTIIMYGFATKEQTTVIPVYNDNITLSGYDATKDSLIIYRTAYLPATDAIDTFYTKYDTLKVQQTPLSDYTRAELKADGPGNTYELINSVLGGTAEETPDCSDPSFGRHIREEYNDELGENVFAFYLHVTPDNDRCVNFDRQRCEIKTYGPSPDSLKAFNGDQMIFQWKFRLPEGFQPSYSFTHIHQLKAGDGPNDGSPIITITPRYASPEKLQIIHNGDSKATSLGTVKEVDLAPFKGSWIQATEKVTFGTHGAYQLELKKISDGSVLLSYTNNDIDLWRTGTTFVRPKWGIYRSLNHPEQLRDEKVLFADFVIEKNK